VLAHHEVRVGVGSAVTDRHGGVSTTPWQSLNLSADVGDDPTAVTENRHRVARALGLSADAFVTMQQVHGAEVAVVDAVPDVAPEADALVTRTAGVVLVVRVADCTPVLLWDRRARVVAAVHVGRRGLAAGVLPAAIASMGRLHARPDRTYAVVGPGICPEHYEVPIAMRDEVAKAAPAAAAVTTAGASALDIRAGLLAQLSDCGLQRWMVMPQCTAETEALFSYRRDGVTGRSAGLVWLEP
jgi:YfiH family protein